MPAARLNSRLFRMCWSRLVVVSASRPRFIRSIFGELLPPQAATAADPAAPSIFTALQEQLGLRFESAKAPLPVLIIDSDSQLRDLISKSLAGKRSVPLGCGTMVYLMSDSCV